MHQRLLYNQEYRVLISPDAGFDSIPVTPCFTVGKANEITSIKNGQSLYFYQVEYPAGESPWYVFATSNIEEHLRLRRSWVTYNNARQELEYVFVPAACLQYLAVPRKKTKRHARHTVTGTRPLSKKTNLMNKSGQTATAGNIAIAPPISGVQLVPFRKIVKK